MERVFRLQRISNAVSGKLIFKSNKITISYSLRFLKYNVVTLKISRIYMLLKYCTFEIR